MLRPFTRISIQQVPTEQWKDRTLDLNLDFVSEWEVTKTWESRTDTAKIVLPKNILIERKSDKALFHQRGTFNVVLGGSGFLGDGYNIDPAGNSNTNPPLLLKGDVVQIFDGYMYKNEQGQDIIVQKKRFSGYISTVSSTIPIEITLEDNNYLLKLTPVNITLFEGNLLKLCQYIADQVNANFGANAAYKRAKLVDYDLQYGTPIYEGDSLYPIIRVTDEVDELTAAFTLGHLDIGTGLNCAQLLERLSQNFRLKSFFTDNDIHIGFPIYNEARANSKNFFEFQNNIFDNDLEYKNKDDIILSAVVNCQMIKPTERKTRDGHNGTKRELKSVLVYWDVPTQSFKYMEKERDKPFPANQGGERHEFPYAVAPGEDISATKLAQWGIEHLKKYCYTGFRGSFETFGYPFVEWNDNINLVDPVISDRCGQYKTKKVKYSGGVDGHAQRVFLDYRQEIQMPNIDDAIKISMI